MSPRVKPLTPGWPSRDILRAAAIVAAVYVALKLLWVGHDVFLLGFFGVLLGIVLTAGVDRLERLRIPRGIGAVLILLLFFGALTGVGFFAAPQISSQMGEVRQQLPQSLDKLERWIQQRGGGVAALVKAAADTTLGAGTEKADTSQRQGARGRDTTAQSGQRVDLRRSLNQQLAGRGAELLLVLLFDRSGAGRSDHHALRRDLRRRGSGHVPPGADAPLPPPVRGRAGRC